MNPRAADGREKTRSNFRAAATAAVTSRVRFIFSDCRRGRPPTTRLRRRVPPHGTLRFFKHIFLFMYIYIHTLNHSVFL